MSGFAARTEPAEGCHDPLTARALVVEDTAIVWVDVIGLAPETCRRIREGCVLPADQVVVGAVHTHGGPMCMPGQLGEASDAEYLARLEQACIEAIDTACSQRRPARLWTGEGTDPDVARNRRHAEGPIDRSLPVLGVRGEDGAWLAVVTSYACHPVVLGAGNRQWTADYPGEVRRALEEAYPGAVALFMTGCAGDLNTGHAASASFRVEAAPQRTFAEAQRIGQLIAERVQAASLRELPSGPVQWAVSEVALGFVRREQDSPTELAEQWRREAEEDSGRAALLESWIYWAENVAGRELEPWLARVTVFDWGGVPFIALPGEIFASTALAIREKLGAAGAFVVCFAQGCPGYLPPREEYSHGGYEVDEAHRYYGMPATFAPGSAEQLATLAVTLHRRIRGDQQT
jgi:hypothetical protein